MRLLVGWLGVRSVCLNRAGSCTSMLPIRALAKVMNVLGRFAAQDLQRVDRVSSLCVVERRGCTHQWRPEEGSAWKDAGKALWRFACVSVCVCVCMCVLVCGIKTTWKCPVQSCPHAAGGREEDSWHPDYQYLFQVVRMRLEEGRRIVGTLIPSSAMDTLVRTLKVTNAKVEFLNAYG